MPFSSWPFSWLQQLTQRWFPHGRRRHSRRIPTPTRRWVRPRLEGLEDRLTPSGDTLALFPAGKEIAPNQPSGAITVQLESSAFRAVTAASDVTVNLSSSSSTGQFLDLSGHPLANSSVVIPAGSSFALFEYEDSQTGIPAITATASGFNSSGGFYDVNVQGALAFTTPAQALAANQLSQPITVQLQDGNGNAVAATSNVTVNLSVNSFPNGGQFFDTSGNPLSTPSITIPAGSSSASFEYEDSQTGFPLLAAQVNGDQVLQQESVGNPLFLATPSQILTLGQPSRPITVALENAAPSDMTIQLTSTSSTGQFLDTSGNPLSNSSITISAGSRSGSFEYEDSQAGAPSLEAFSSDLDATAFVQETVGGSSGFVNIVSPAQAMVPNQPAQITVQLLDLHGNPVPAANDLTLTLGSSSSTGQFLDTSGNPLANSSIVLPAGASTASFEYQDSQVGIPKLTVSWMGFGGATQLTTQQEDVGASLAFTSAGQTFATGQASQPITVRLQDSSGNPITASSDVTVNLFSSQSQGSQFLDTSGNPLTGFLPTITIAAGSSLASFEYKSVWGGTPTLTAEVGGNAPILASLAATQQETINGLSSLVFTTSPQTIPVNQTPQTSSLITVQLEDNNGNAVVAPSSGLTVQLQAASSFLLGESDPNVMFLDANGNPLPTGGSSFLTYSTISIPAGASTVSFKFQDQTTLASGFTLIASIPNSLLLGEQMETVQSGPPTSVAFGTLAQSQAASVPSGSITVVLRDQYGNPAPAPSGGVTVNLSSSSTGGQFLSVAGDPLASPSVTIPQGVSSATIEYVDSQAGTPILTAAASGLTSGTQTETITPVSAEIHVTNTNDSGDGSLRAAITQANANRGSTIVFDVTGTIDLLSGLPTITASTNIVGPGADKLLIERSPLATGTFSGFDIQSTSLLSIPTVTISGLTVANFNDAGIMGGGYLTLRQAVVRNNSIDRLNAFILGGLAGGIIAGPNLTVLDSTIADNTATNLLGGDGAGGIDSDGGYTTIINSTISGNAANDNSGGDGGVRLVGGAYIANSTISGNSGSDIGGGLAGGLESHGGVTLYNTIVAGNTGSGGSSSDVFGMFTSLGNNLIGNAGTRSSGFVSSDQVGSATNPINPLLGPLQDNGGPTPTMALLTGSPAIGAGSSANAPATDQRGVARPSQGAIDIGAFELTTNSTTVAPVITSDPTSQSVTAGANVSFTASASGTPTPLVQWQVSTDGGQTFSDIVGATSTTLTLPNVTTALSGNEYHAVFTNSAGSITSTAATLTVTAAVPAITLSPSSVLAGTTGVAYNQTITASGGSGNVTVTYQVLSGSIPKGMTFTPSGNQLTIGGTPKSSGSVTFAVTATDAAGDTITQNYNLTINAAVSINLSTKKLSAGSVSASYNQSIIASGGSGNLTVTYQVVSGSIPAGLTFNVTSGELDITGTPTAVGSVTFDVTVTDPAGDTTTQRYDLKIRKK